MISNYKLSVIIPCWKCEDEIGEMLDSIINQSFQDWQVFCVDDQSPDNTVNVLKDYSLKDDRIHYKVRDREPKGAQTCRNIGYELSQGAQYVIWFDADDLVAPCCFMQRVTYMDNHPDLDFGVFPAQTFKNSIKENLKGGYGFPIFDDDLEAFLLWVLPMVGWTNIYRRESLAKVQHSWDENVWSLQDSDFNIQSILKKLKYDYAYKEGAQVDYYYRVTGGLSKKIPTHYASHFYLLNKVLDSFSKEQTSFYKYALQTYCIRFAMIFKNNKKYFNSFLKIPFVQNDKWFYWRLLAWRLCRYRLTYRLFFRHILGEVLAKESLKTNFFQFEFEKNTSV